MFFSYDKKIVKSLYLNEIYTAELAVVEIILSNFYQNILKIEYRLFHWTFHTTLAV